MHTLCAVFFVLKVTSKLESCVLLLLLPLLLLLLLLFLMMLLLHEVELL